MISAVAETLGASIDEVKFYYFFYSNEILKRIENLAENAISGFCPIRWKFFKQSL